MNTAGNLLSSFIIVTVTLLGSLLVKSLGSEDSLIMRLNVSDSS